MKYTVRVNKVKKNDGSLRGFATVVFGGSFKITNIAILESSEGKLFVSMPRYRSSEVDEHNQTVYKDICNPITAEFRAELYGDILKEYENMAEYGKVQTDEKDMETEMPEFKVAVTPFEREGSNIRGLGRIYLDDCFVINNVSLVQGKDNVFVAMPSYKTKQTGENGKSTYQDVCYPVTKEFREKLYGEIQKSYEFSKQKEQTQRQQSNKERGNEFMTIDYRNMTFR